MRNAIERLSATYEAVHWTEEPMWTSFREEDEDIVGTLGASTNTGRIEIQVRITPADLATVETPEEIYNYTLSVMNRAMDDIYKKAAATYE